MRSLPESTRRRLGTLIFSAKESVYKCQYPFSRTVIDFDALTLRFDMRNAVFEASFNQRAGLFRPGTRVRGRFAVSSGMIMTSAQLAPSQVAALTQEAAL